jgi:hypothetical protein
MHDWAETELNAMNAKIATLESKLGQLHGDARTRAESALSEMRTKRDAFQETLKKDGTSAQADLSQAKAALDTHLSAFEASAKQALSHTGSGSR